MLKLIRAAGLLSEIWQLFIEKNDGTGDGLTGLAFNTASLTAYYHRDTDTTATAITLVTMTVGTFTSSGFKEIDATNMPGWYQFCPPNAALAAGAKSVAFHFKGAAGMHQRAIEVQLDAAPANLKQIDELATNGNNATLNLKKLNVVNSAGDAIVATSTGSNGYGIKATGNGAGDGLLAQGGDTGNGIDGRGGATYGSGILGVATATDNEGIYGQADDGPGIAAYGGGVHPGLLAKGDAAAVGTNADGMACEKAGTGVDIRGELSALAVVTRAEPSSVPAASATITDMVHWLYTLARNKVTQTSSTQTLRNDGDSGTIGTAAVSDNGTTATRGKFA